MLSEIRERATGWIAYVIVGIIVIPFAFWGVNEYFAGGEDVIVATVNGAEIEQTQYRQALDNRRAQMRRVLGERFEPELANSPEFKRGVIDDLVSQILLSRHADEYGYHVGDTQLAETIRSNPRFQDGDQFSQDVYRNAVARMGLTETGFEARMRQQLVLQQIRDGVTESSFTEPQQAKRLLRLYLEERSFDHAVVEAGSYVDEMTVSDEEISSEYDANSDSYRTPEQMKIEYIELSVDALASDVSVTEEDIERAYEQNRDRFTTDPVRRASHILIEVSEDAGEEALQEAMDKAQGLLEQLRSGADFETLAREHSDDPGSATQGGDLGTIEPGGMVQPFENALFALEEEGTLAGPVRTRFGYHLIKLTEYEPANVKPLEEVRTQLEKEERDRQAEALFLDRAEAFRNITYEQPRSLEPAADQLDLDVQEGGWFTREQGDGIASNPRVRETAFGVDVFEEGLNSEAIELDINTLVVVRKLDTRPASLKPLAEVRDEIERRLKRSKAREHVASMAPRLVEQLEQGGDWESLMEQRSLTSTRTTWSRAEPPEAPRPAAVLVESVYRAPEPAGGAPVYGGTPLPDGNYALFRLMEVTTGDPDQAPEEIQGRIRETLSSRRGSDMLEQYVADLRERAEVDIKEDHL